MLRMKGDPLVLLMVVFVPVVVCGVGLGVSAEPKLQVWHDISDNGIRIHAKVSGFDHLTGLQPEVQILTVRPNYGSETRSGPPMEPADQGEWVASISPDVTMYQVSLDRADGPTLVSGLILVENDPNHDEKQVSLRITVENPNLSLQTFCVIKANASSPKGMYDVRIGYTRFTPD